MEIVTATCRLHFELVAAGKVNITLEMFILLHRSVLTCLRVPPLRCEAKVDNVKLYILEDIFVSQFRLLDRNMLIIADQNVVGLQIVKHEATFVDHFEDVEK